jgi:ATP-dependent exoDNAse (exonuclease V) beta subunit
MLAVQNAHPRDAEIEFEEVAHVYTIRGEVGYTSVTTFCHGNFSVFDAERIVDGMLRGRKMQDPTYKYFGMTREQILASWDANRDAASSAGTKLHYDIECFYNGIFNKNESVEFGYFAAFVRDHAHLTPYRTEWCVFDEDLRIAGSIDMVFENAAGDLLIYDWKRAKEIVYESPFGKAALTPCIAHLPDTNFWHYSLQLNMYRAILQRKYGKKVVELCLVVLHPDNFGKTYELVEVPMLDAEIEALLALRYGEAIAGAATPAH